ncbi:N(5)-(carboxyethyl)ornithine synthase [Butyrivibrio sp. TB]|uniref:N(5)-(carboxyethyl)ornithine synthase n=1 Tax=Butyrivibrio sp. TB TaxID=1520809 RepID=UPI0008CE39C7|nr:N(5)-(carboxyethyl)ornithine synthase [Butyrivibrio sp. TB]SEP83378.1 N5-(carboxyethyl)ornithine synthase [Butyrivibrio sp. TB]
MNTVGFLISHKNNEKRRALMPDDIGQIKNLDNLVFEKGYGESIGIPDSEYTKKGIKFESRSEVLKCPVLVDVKLGDADYLDKIAPETILCGWAHSVQNIDFTSEILRAKHTVIAWENIYEQGRYIFYRNREIAGEAAVLQAFQYCGKMPYDTKVAIIGNGQTAKGAMRVLTALGAQVDVFGRKLEKTFLALMPNYDVLVNCVLWDTDRTDRLIYREDLKRLKPGTMIVDVSCDPHLEIETSHPTTIDNPVYVVDGILHYAVDNTPAMYPYTVSKILSQNFAKYVDCIVTGDYPENIVAAIDVDHGIIKNDAIRRFREARGIFVDKVS